MTEQVSINVKLRRRLSVGLAAATVVVALLFLAGSVLLMESWFASQVAKTGLTLESFPAAFSISAIVLSTGAFVISWKRRSFIVAGLLAASGVILMIHPLTSIFMPHMVTERLVTGPLLGVILGLGILGLGVAKGIRTAKMVGEQ